MSNSNGDTLVLKIDDINKITRNKNNIIYILYAFEKTQYVIRK